METAESEKLNSSELINIEWEAPEFQKYEKSRIWFIVAALFALIFFALALLMRNFIFAFMIILMILSVFLYATKQPRIIRFKISGEGIYVENKLYPYDGIKSFWIDYEPPDLKQLLIVGKKRFSSLVSIPLADQDPVQIRTSLLKFIPEEKQEQSISDAIARRLRF